MADESWIARIGGGWPLEWRPWPSSAWSHVLNGGTRAGALSPSWAYTIHAKLPQLAWRSTLQRGPIKRDVRRNNTGNHGVQEGGRSSAQLQPRNLIKHKQNTSHDPSTSDQVSRPRLAADQTNLPRSRVISHRKTGSKSVEANPRTVPGFHGQVEILANISRLRISARIAVSIP